MSSLSKEYIETVIKRAKYYKSLGDKTFEQLADFDFHYQPNAVSNSIAIIIQHLHGNMMSRWTNFLQEDGEKEWRQRDAEFEAQDFNKYQLLLLWEEGWNCFLTALKPLKKKHLLKTIFIRKEPLTVMDAINRQLAHYPYHVGQIVYIGRMIKIEQWKNLSIPKNESTQFNANEGIKDPANR